MPIDITNAVVHDLPVIYQLFEEAILFQKRNQYIGWDSYDKEYIQEDVQNGLLFKMVQDNTIACIFSICYSDPLIWREKENGDAIYLHRIVLNRVYKNEKAFKTVLEWAISHAREKQVSYIRMDTWADNEKIIGYYKSYGFHFIENYTTPGTPDLPLQHRNLNVALLEFEVHDLQKVNIQNGFSQIDTYWNQKIIGQANGQLIKLAKGLGELNWHKHDDQDELFILYKGHLTIQLRNKDIELNKDDMFIVPKGVEHCPRANGEVEFLIMGLNITSNKAGGRPDNFPLYHDTL
ncbi:cupin domain-containing protein [Flavihumibacter profundi]|uniref:cupin domain-containing protein n=1 Tax=Flavihumibacter profundi TaxID=2716883 RepID=UPI001CC33800|nr:cupin domain-containing protein [Flavihumibacter profundi]MBZ5857613.1 cupin domain-containing protein [Flavihumibacter profundi]